MENWKKLLRNNFFLILLAGTIISFFYPAILSKKIPIPADTIVGMYHPWRDNIWDNFISGVPYKNFLITDPVRQQYVWRNLAIEQLKNGQLPLWNPYSFSGTPLLANFQSASFYPLNILFFILPFNTAWTVLIILQPLLAGIFLYLYLRYMKVSPAGSFLGAFTFAFCGFSIAWLEWNTIIQTVLWLPLILLAKEKLLQKSSLKWVLILIFAEASSILAGHLQILFYTLIISNVYLLIRIIQLSINNQSKENIFLAAFKKYLPFLFIGAAVLLITAIGWLPAMQFILQSGRDLDQGSFLKEGWFIPWQNLVQFIAPDFFGNPATGNYWGIWNYGEFIGFTGIVPLIFALYAFLFRRDKKTLFFGSFAILSLLFALPTPLAKIPYQLAIPLISTSQPTRLMFVTDFSLAILAALGFDKFLKERIPKRTLATVLILGGLILFLWVFVTNSASFQASVDQQYSTIAKRNLILPTITVILAAVSFLIFSLLKRKNKFVTSLLYSIVVILTVADLFRFGWKFTPFTKQDWIFPETKIINTLKEDKDHSRFMAIDRRIMPPNFSAAYKLFDVAGYDPLYLKDYGQLVSSWERDKPDITPASFNRIITPVNYESFIADLLGVKYILSLSPLESSKLYYIKHEGDTYLYINTRVMPRVFLAESTVKVGNKQEALEKMYDLKDSLRSIAVMTDDINLTHQYVSPSERAEIISYQPDKVDIRSDVLVARLLVLSDIYYPSWKAYVDGQETKIFQVDFALRGIVVPKGLHKIEFKNSLL